MKEDQEQIKLLAVFHYVVAGLSALFALFPIIHLIVGFAVLTEAFGKEAGFMPQLIGLGFVIFAGSWIISGLTFAICLAFSGWFLSKHKKYLFCLVMAAIACAFMPLGTVLGVFTIIVLMRDSVKRLFGREPTVAKEETV